MNTIVKSAYAAVVGIALTLALTSAHAEPQKIDFEQGVDTAQILEALRRQTPITSINADTLIPARTASTEAGLAKIGPVTGIDTTARVQDSEPYAAALEYPPLIEVLEPADRDPLREEWKSINTERTGLLSEADDLETEDWKLYDRAVAIDENAERLNNRQERLGAEIDNFNRQCTGRPLPPDEYNACLRWQTDLQQRIREHNAEVVQHNNKVEQWKKEVADLRNRVGTTLSGTPKRKTNLSFLGRVAAWEQRKIAPFIDRAAKAVQRGRVTRVTVEAQGANPPVQKSVSLVTRETVCKSIGDSMLGELLAQLTDSEREDRIEAFAKAHAWIASRPTEGVTAPPPVRVTFQNENRRDPTARVDINVWAGTAFITCPCCSK